MTMEFLDTLETFFENFPAWLTAIMALMVAAKGITAMTPTRADDKAVAFVLRLLNLLALNVGKARNADDKPPSSAGGTLG